MNPKIKGKGNTMLDYCDETSIYAIRNIMVLNIRNIVIINHLVVLSLTKSKATLVGFVHMLSIMNVDFTASIGLPNGVTIAHLKGSSVKKICSKSLVSTSQHHKFVI